MANLESKLTKSINNLGADILARRKAGSLTYVVEGRDAAHDTMPYLAILDDLVSKVGFSGLGADWREIDRQGAQAILQHILHKDLAYGAEIMDAALAKNYTMRFLEQFDEGARFFTNATYLEPEMRLIEWLPITAATFDTGVVCIGGQRIGMIWIEDED